MPLPISDLLRPPTAGSALLALLSWACIVGPPGLAGQDRPPEGNPMALPAGMCEAVDDRLTADPPPNREDREQAEGLMAEASQASILGDDAQALQLLRQAAALDPTSASIHYRLGRLLEGANEEDEAVSQFCRYLALTPDGPEAAEVRDRIDRMAGPFDVTGLRATEERAAEAAAREAAEEEERRAAAQRAAEELAAEERAAEERAAAQRAAADRAADRDADADAEREERDGAAAPSAQPRGSGPLGPTPTTVLVTGMLMPGMGHIYAGQPQTGLVVLGAAVGSLATGMLYRRLDVYCLVLPVDGACPEGQERGREESRPLLGPSIALAAIVTVGGAIHAWMSTRDAPPRLSAAGAGSEGAVAFLLARDGGVALTLEPAAGSGGQGLHALRAGFRVSF